jgi:hypothetical protein
MRLLLNIRNFANHNCWELEIAIVEGVTPRKLANVTNQGSQLPY